MSAMLESEMDCANMLLEIGNDPRLKRSEPKDSFAEQDHEEEQSHKEEYSDTHSDGNEDDTCVDDHREEHITDPGQHDVLCGRGGGTNNHAGNVKFRLMVNDHKLRYLAASKAEKPKVAAEVVRLWRALDPPGRFLSRKDKSRKGPGSVKADGTVWYDVGNKKAREKASQCLRERTPEVIPFVREIQRQQDILTGQGLLHVEQQMKQQGDTPTPPADSTPQPAPTAQLPAQPPLTTSLPHSLEMTKAEVANALLLGHFRANGFMNNVQQGPSSTSQFASISQAPVGNLQVFPSHDMTQAEVANAFLLSHFASTGLPNNSAASLLNALGPTNPFNLSYLATLSSGNGSGGMFTGNSNPPPAHGFSLPSTDTTTTLPSASAKKRSVSAAIKPEPIKKRKQKIGTRGLGSNTADVKGAPYHLSDHCFVRKKS